MLFNTMEFFWFFLLVTAGFFIVPHRYRWGVLLAANYYFYMQWNVKYTVLIVLSTVIDYFAALAIGRAKGRRGKNWAVATSLAGNLGLLFVFKYYNFAAETFNLLNQWLGTGVVIPYHSLLLPVGISFYTFQTLSYTLDVYKGRQEPEKHFGIFALYVSFFPQLVAGPIERCSRLLPQFREVKRFRWENLWPGLTMILSGLIKKVVIADRMAIVVDTVYGNIPAHTGAELALATVFYAFQIYCDFSGYSDIAIGTAKIMDYDLMRNFERPYLSRSIGEFWRRWHISLSTWFRDYVFIPLGGSRLGELRTAGNLLLVFFISGVWHGASFNFMVWGLLNGFYLLMERYWLNGLYSRLESLRPNNWLLPPLQIGVTFTLTCFSWIFFRAQTLPEAFRIIRAILFDPPLLRLSTLGLEAAELTVGITSILILMSVEAHRHFRSTSGAEKPSPFPLRLALAYAMVFALILFGVYGEYDAKQFVYFAF